jgi:hypothetical protein
MAQLWLRPGRAVFSVRSLCDLCENLEACEMRFIRENHASTNLST